ncbi:MAG: hypothetical protein ACE5HS_00075 [bacterium]
MKQQSNSKNHESLKRILKPFDYLFILKPTLFFAVWTIYLAGFFVQNKAAHASENSGLSNQILTAEPGQLLWVGFILTLLMGAVFILQQVKEPSPRSKKGKWHLIGQEHLPARVAYIESGMLTLIALILAFDASVKFGILSLAILFIMGIAYNFEPFHWKQKPIWGLVTNLVWALLLFSSGWMINGLLKQELILRAIPYVAAVAAVYLFSTLPEKEKDTSEGQTVGAKLGIKTTAYVGLILTILVVVVAFIMQDELAFYPAFLSIPFFVWAVVKLRPEDIQRAIKFPVLLFAIAICIKYKLELDSNTYFFILAGLYLFSRAYYKLRFGVDYPRLSV